MEASPYFRLDVSISDTIDTITTSSGLIDFPTFYNLASTVGRAGLAADLANALGAGATVHAIRTSEDNVVFYFRCTGNTPLKVTDLNGVDFQFLQVETIQFDTTGTETGSGIITYEWLLNDTAQSTIAIWDKPLELLNENDTVKIRLTNAMNGMDEETITLDDTILGFSDGTQFFSDGEGNVFQ